VADFIGRYGTKKLMKMKLKKSLPVPLMKTDKVFLRTKDEVYRRGHLWAETIWTGASTALPAPPSLNQFEDVVRHGW
jgi:hypothetical protein